MDTHANAGVVLDAQSMQHTTSSGHLKTLRAETIGAAEHTSR
jgi:hypothetical protein